MTFRRRGCTCLIILTGSVPSETAMRSSFSLAAVSLSEARTSDYCEIPEESTLRLLANQELPARGGH